MTVGVIGPPTLSLHHLSVGIAKEIIFTLVVGDYLISSSLETSLLSFTFEKSAFLLR